MFSGNEEALNDVYVYSQQVSRVQL